MSINPFNYGKPIDDPERFVGHHREVEQVYSRLLSAFESTSIVGERRVGKTSLLKYLAHSQTAVNFGLDPAKYTFIYQDFQLLDENTVPTRFWQRVLRAIKRVVKGHEEIVDEIDLAIKGDTIDNYTLDDIFTLIDEEGLYIVLLLDEFENVTRNQHFDSDFFGGLRSLAIHHNLALVTSSRQSLVELTHSEEVRSSPFFNIFATINLRAFTEEEATDLIDRYLANTEVKFRISELNIIFALAGYHPHFLQMACYHLFAAYQKEIDGAERSHYVIDQVRNEANPLFIDYWRDSSSAQQVLLTVMALRELDRDGGEDTLEDLEKYYARADQVIGELERRALVIQNPTSCAYHLFSTELREWVVDEVLADMEDLRGWRDWHKGESLIGKLPTNLQDKLAELAPALNPEYRDVLGNWLLEPSTAQASLDLMDKCISRYQNHKEKQKQEFVSKMADQQEPVGDTPKGLFARLSQQLEDGPGAAPSVPSSSAAPAPPERTSTGRMLRKSKKKAGVSPTAIRGLIISGIITQLDLESDDQEFVSGELNWQFSAADHLLKICRNEVDRSQPVPVDIPPDAERLAEANNRLLTTIDDATLEGWKSWTETRLDWVNAWLKELDLLLGQEASRGIAGKSDLELQNKMKSKRVEIVQVVEEMAQLMNQAYGILVTSPGQIVELLED
jgi:AAA+ ATPase superfamily predicted ATPase